MASIIITPMGTVAVAESCIHHRRMRSATGPRLRQGLWRTSCAAAFLWLLLGLAGSPVAAQTPTPAARDSAPEVYVIRRGDVLRIWVWPDTALGGRFPVEESGLVYLPVIGEVHAAGMTIDALRAQLRQGYLQAIRTPIVSVTPLFRVSVLGAVERPGLYEIDPTLSLFDVISLAGGLRREAKANELRVIRDGGRVFEVNAKQALESGEALLALSLRSGDRIVVPERNRFLSAQNVFFVLQAAVVAVSLVNLLR